jgi:hypothetical protein
MVLSAFVMVSACAQTPVDTSPVPVLPKPARSGRFSRYRFEINSRAVDFNLLVNGAELLVAEGAKTAVFSVPINDWMVSGNNEISITLFWPENIRFVPGAASASFVLYANDAVLREYAWPREDVPDTQESYPYTVNETFRAEGFPRVMMEKAHRVISSMGALPRSDQDEISALVEELRRAFTEKDVYRIGELFRVKYADLAAARFSTPAAVKGELESQYLTLMEKEAYAVRPFYGRYGFFSAADDRVIRVVQGRVGFPEAALSITYREDRKAARYDLDLYLAKIDGKWLIIR